MSKRKENALEDVNKTTNSAIDTDSSNKRKKTIDTNDDELEKSFDQVIASCSSKSPTSKPRDKTTKTFPCADCEKVFNHKSNLTKHAKRHATLHYVYHCSCCNYSFKSRESIKKHLKLLSKDVKSIVCTRSYVNALTQIPVGESVVINLNSRSPRTKKKQSTKKLEDLAKNSSAKLPQVLVHTKQSSETNRKFKF